MIKTIIKYLDQLLNRLLDHISSKFDISEERRVEMHDYDRKRARMIQMIAKTPKLSKFKLFWISQFMTLFGCGKSKIAPGTVTSFVTVILWFMTTLFFIRNNSSPLTEGIFWTSIIVVCSIYAVIFTPIYTRDFDNYDHQSIVIDEVIGQLITLCLSYTVARSYYHEESWILPQIVIVSHIFLSFLLFRTFDIAKPSVIGWIDRNLKSPFGVVLDDIVAGLISAILIMALFVFYESSIINLHDF